MSILAKYYVSARLYSIYAHCKWNSDGKMSTESSASMYACNKCVKSYRVYGIEALCLHFKKWFRYKTVWARHYNVKMECKQWFFRRQTISNIVRCMCIVASEQTRTSRQSYLRFIFMLTKWRKKTHREESTVEENATVTATI